MNQFVAWNDAGGDHGGPAMSRSGKAGRVENCQIGVFLCYASRNGAAFLDRALYQPKEWTHDEERRHEAGVPESVPFPTKPQLARAMLARAVDAGVPCGWVTGDAVYGGDRRLRLLLEQRDQSFVLAVTCKEPLMVGTGFVLTWSTWRRRHQMRANRCRYKRRGATCAA